MAQDKKQSREELLEQPDAVTLYLQQFAEFIRRYQKQLIVAGVVFVILVLAASGGVYYVNKAEDEASAMLGRAMDRYESVQAQNGDPAAYEALKKKFKTVMDQYGFTDAGEMARVQYASICYESGEYEKAVEAYETALDEFGGNPQFNDMIVTGLAYAYQATGDYDNAVKYFEKVAEDESAVTRDQALFNLGQLYGRLGKTEQSRKTYEKIVSEFPDSIYVEPAKMELAG
ncbi:MAG: tetratricopeptide repeat protein [Thermodesulfobacteriota bacterium]